MKIKYLDPRLSDTPPAYATVGAAGLDCRACIDQTWYIYPQEQKIISLGFAVHIENPNLAGLLLPRSGLGCKGLILANTIGLIDSDYQGELKAVVWNRNEPGTPPIEIRPLDRIAQLVLIPVYHQELIHVSEFEASERGADGFGSSGLM
jgi:dUTP pyrophosphatase